MQFSSGYGGQLWFRACMAAHDEGVAVIRKVSWLEVGAYGSHVGRKKIETVLQVGSNSPSATFAKTGKSKE